MKWNGAAKNVVLALALVAATSAFAINKGTLRISEAAQIGGQPVSAGEYQLRWDGAGPNVEVSVLQGRKLVAKVPAQLVEQKQAAANDAAVVDRTGATPTVKEVRFAGKKYSLALSSDRASMGGSMK